MTSTLAPTLMTSISLLDPSMQNTLAPEVLEVMQKFEFDQDNQELTKQFGVLTLTVPEQPATLTSDRVYHWVLTVDRSGSMDRSHEGGQYTRLDYVKHTLRHLLMHIVANITFPNLLSIQVFDHQSEFIVDKLTLTPDDNTLVENIYKNYILPIEARGATNIYDAMESANKLILDATITAETSRFIPTHIFLTDGGATSGITNETAIADMCADHEINVMAQGAQGTQGTGAQGTQGDGAQGIGTQGTGTQGDGAPTKCPPKLMVVGFGADHNSPMLQTIEDHVTNCKYSFVDDYERAGMIYGEIAYDVFSEAFYNITIKSLGDYNLYDFLTDTWTKEIRIPTVAYEMVKHIHIYSDLHQESSQTPPADIVVEYTRPEQTIGDEHYTPSILQSIPDVDLSTLSQEELVKFRFRHDALGIMFRTRALCDKINHAHHNRWSYDHANETLLNLEEAAILTEIENSTRTISSWMARTDNGDDLILEQICEDLHVAVYSLQNIRNSGMYLNSRFSAQGHQRGYSVALPTADTMQYGGDPRYNRLRRTDSTSTVDDMDADPNRVLHPQPQLHRESSAYSTPSQRFTMEELDSSI